MLDNKPTFDIQIRQCPFKQCGPTVVVNCETVGANPHLSSSGCAHIKPTAVLPVGALYGLSWRNFSSGHRKPILLYVVILPLRRNSVSFSFQCPHVAHVTCIIQWSQTANCGSQYWCEMWGTSGSPWASFWVPPEQLVKCSVLPPSTYTQFF